MWRSALFFYSFSSFSWYGTFYSVKTELFSARFRIKCINLNGITENDPTLDISHIQIICEKILTNGLCENTAKKERNIEKKNRQIV